ncbi:MAG TPA: universal stress protein [Nitrososphaeraceae archaeon]|nr:universal stress protein [Nitrososphaeraceae archaeon]
MKRKQMSSILVAIDGSKYADKAFENACELSIMKNIPLIIINVVEEYATIGNSILRELKKSSTNILHEYKGRAESLGIQKSRTISRVGNAAEEILKIANRKNIDTLVIGTRGKYGTSEDMLGGTSYKLIHYCKCTVTVVK